MRTLEFVARVRGGVSKRLMFGTAGNAVEDVMGTFALVIGGTRLVIFLLYLFCSRLWTCLCTEIADYSRFETLCLISKLIVIFSRLINL